MNTFSLCNQPPGLVSMGLIKRTACHVSCLAEVVSCRVSCEASGSHRRCGVAGWAIARAGSGWSWGRAPSTPSLLSGIPSCIFSTLYPMPVGIPT